ncbi:Gfo/Idh/MocA family oxidoreductase [Paenibacillus sp. GD4]|uniref:Gfo/Idh/MocA family protein n=1 Tax=Paenibacillus sp. GD4 TaxID=3068890 RepID=UPI002796C1B8|nr:Gfo/Idh/MocA family oxidoreductase [Paenibacillus sp. GD4]MDQ1913712.1 Gfo/Idh/MocA family oxidoreductase [Paenibacillus sp. GD4]
MKIAVVGCGTMGRTHGAELARMPGVHLVGFCDIQEDAALLLSKAYETKAYSDFDQMLAEANPDIVDICLPTNLHKEYVLRAARKGKHIICEKPIAMAPEDAEEMIEECRKQGVRLFIGHVVRFFPSYADIRHKAEQGVVGRPGVLHARRMGGHPGLAKDWYNHSDISGGVILDLMIHDIDFAQSIFGKVDSVYAMHRKGEGLEYALVTLKFEGGEMAHLEGYWGYPGPFTTSAELAGSGGVIRFNSEESLSIRVCRKTEADSEGPTVAVPKSPTVHSPYYLELEHFIACLRSGLEPTVTATDALSALQIGLMAIESAATGRPVKMKEYRSKRKGEERQHVKH